MTDKPKVWIDPSDCGLVTVEAAAEKRRQDAERQRRAEAKRQLREETLRKKEEEAKERTQALATQPKQEILPPAPKGAVLSLPDANSLALPDLSDLERQIRLAAAMLDLGKPEGWLDSWFDRPDHRIEVKTERGLRLAGYIAACTAILEAARAHQAIRQQIYLDQLVFLRRVAEESYNIELAGRRAERQDAIEAAQAKEIIAAHDGNAREHGLRGRPSPPAPAPLPAPKPEDPRVKNKERLQQELVRLAKEEKEELAKLAGGKPEGEWTDDMKEEIKRTSNMYFHTKQKVREELRNYL
jgi:sRNA-binding protein